MKRPRWYLNVRPKQYLEWDEEKRFAVITLRDGGTTPELIAKAFGTKKTVIYNQTRLTRCSINGVCFKCRRPLKKRRPGRPQLCEICVDKNKKYKKDLRRAAMKNKVCVACGEPAMKGHCYCRSCISATYRRRIKNKKCGTCGKLPIAKSSISQCQKCLKKNRDYARKSRS